MKSVFVKTGNVLRFLAGVEAVMERGAREASLMLLDGRPGLGKTTTVTWWATQNGAALARAKAGWTPTWMLREIIEAMGGVAKRSSHEILFRQLIEVASEEQMAADREGRIFGVVIDEIDHIVPRKDGGEQAERSRVMLETLRDMTDLLNIPVILTGMNKVRDGLVKLPQVASRVAKPVEFVPANLADVRLMARELCEWPVADDLTAVLAKESGGMAREIMEGLARIEAVGRRLRREVTLADFRGKALLNDRRSGREIIVEAA